MSAEGETKNLKECIDTLIDENKRLRHKIEILESEKKERQASNIEEEIKPVLDKLLREYKVADNDRLDWTYHPSRTYPFEPYIGDFPQGPQVGDRYWWPGYPMWWGIIPPYYYPNNVYTTSSNTTGSSKE